MTEDARLTLEQCIAQKLMLDVRRFDAGTGPAPVRELPAALHQGLAELGPCGVILFAENFESIPQTLALTAALRRVLAGPTGLEPLIGIDQEGGRVTRLPREWSTPFSGNMALAACAPQRRETLARQMARAQGRELAALGINLNFAPCLDVNSNPANPVINVRSFGDDPATVAALGAAVVAGFREAGIACAAKHFPGHGDTALDSHTGLPRVERDAAGAEAIDLAPFARVIAAGAPELVMTAHIQYPALDDSTLPGTDCVVPATLSRRVVEGLLRGRLRFGGVVISDALDMRAISDLLPPERAVLACFRAGVDVALMPLPLRGPADLERLRGIVRRVADAVRAGDLDEGELRRSAARVLSLRRRLGRIAGPADAAAARELLACPAHRALEREIAESSITRLGGGTLRPLKSGEPVTIAMPDPAWAAALREALLQLDPGLNIVCRGPEAAEGEALQDAPGTLLVGVAEPADSAVVAGGAEDAAAAANRFGPEAARALLQRAAGRQRIALLLRSPAPAAALCDCAEQILASYDSALRGPDGEPGPAYRALAAVLTGRLEPSGVPPLRPDPRAEAIRR